MKTNSKLKLLGVQKMATYAKTTMSCEIATGIGFVFEQIGSQWLDDSYACVSLFNEVLHAV